MRAFLGVLLAVLLAGCATTQVPPLIRHGPARPVSFTTALAQPTAVVGQQVRWGGTIAGLENRSHETSIEIVDRPLRDNGQPLDVDWSPGRFLARIHGFLDPTIYRVGREITVVGMVAPPVTRNIGEYAYRFPVVDVTDHYLWPRRPPPAPPIYAAPMWYGPYYGPWYPWRRPWPP